MDKVDYTEKHVSFPLEPVTKYDEESNHFPSNPVTKNYEEFDRHRKKRSSLCSTSSGSEYLEECSISSHPESFSSISSDDYNNEKVYVPEFYEIEVGCEMIYWTKNDGDEDMCEFGEWKQVIGRHTQSERITLDCSVFGQGIDHLLPTKSKTRPELQHEFHQIQARIGLPFDKNGNPAPSAALGRQTISAVFGCNDFPSDFMGKTLKAWTENSKTLEFVSISWRTPVKNREDVIAQMAQNYDLPLTHVWKFSKHKESMYALAYFDDEEEKMQKAKKDSVNIYILHPKHENHTAILSVSDYALTLHCAFTQGKEAVPILKQAFNNATQIKDTFYEIHADRINKEVNA